MKMDIGEDGAGHQMKVRRQHGGYYLNVGCSDLIIKGEIGLLQTDDIDRFVSDGVRMRDGRIMKADLVVTATGYEPPHKELALLLGQGVADKVGKVWGLDGKDHDFNHLDKNTAQNCLWFFAGGLDQGRVWLHYVALQIK